MSSSATSTSSQSVSCMWEVDSIQTSLKLLFTLQPIIEYRLCLWALLMCGHWWNKRQELCCEKSIGVWWRMYKIHKRVTGIRDPDSDSGQTTRNPPSRHPDALSKHSTIFHVIIFIRQRWCFFKGVTIVKHIKGQVWIGCFGLSNSITTWIYVYLLWTIIKYDVLAKNKKVRVQESTKVCSVPLATLKDWQFWMFLCHKAHFFSLIFNVVIIW